MSILLGMFSIFSLLDFEYSRKFSLFFSFETSLIKNKNFNFTPLSILMKKNVVVYFISRETCGFTKLLSSTVQRQGIRK